MDVEKTIAFLLSNQAGHDERLTRLEMVVGSLAGTVEKLADSVQRLDEAMASLAESGIQTNQRLDQLVSAVGAMIRQQPGQPSAE